MLKRIKQAFRTNEPQVSSVLFMSFLMLIACLSRGSYTPWWAYILCVIFWPLLAFIANLISPIPKD